MNPSSNFQDFSLSKSAQNGVSTFVKIACEYIGNKCVNLCKFCESDFGVIISGEIVANDWVITVIMKSRMLCRFQAIFSNMHFYAFYALRLGK